MCETHGVFCSIIPPHMIDCMARRGDSAVKEMAQGLQKLAASYRSERAAAEPAQSFMPAPVLAAAAIPGPDREVFDGKKKAGLPGTSVRAEGDGPTGDQAVDDAYDGAGSTYDLYGHEYGRDSLDGNGLQMKLTVHHRRNYGNAFWNGSQMVFGDGDGTLFQGFTDLGVVAHELTHGVVQFSGGLRYQDQPGALNESFADVMGALTVQRALGQEAHEASWLIGEEVLAPGIQGEALRSLRAPGTAYDDPALGRDPQPWHMKGYVFTQSDHGGVHINSGIPNHAFYLLSVMLGGRAWERAGRIWYETLQNLNNDLANFPQWAQATIDRARAIFGAGSMEQRLTSRVWKLVGVL